MNNLTEKYNIEAYPHSCRAGSAEAAVMGAARLLINDLKLDIIL